MTPKEFFDKVCRMRKAQKEYFRTRSEGGALCSKRLEKEIDAEIDKVSGRGTWDKNPYVVVYEYELVK